MRGMRALMWSFLCAMSATSVAAEDLLPMSRVVQLPVESDPTVSFRILFAVGSQDDPRSPDPALPPGGQLWCLDGR